MLKLPITTVTAPLLALLSIVLSVRVVQARFESKTSMDAGEGTSVGTGQDASASRLLVAAPNEHLSMRPLGTRDGERHARSVFGKGGPEAVALTIRLC